MVLGAENQQIHAVGKAARNHNEITVTAESIKYTSIEERKPS